MSCRIVQHNVPAMQGPEPGPLDPKSSALTMRTPCLPQKSSAWLKKKGKKEEVHSNFKELKSVEQDN